MSVYGYILNESCHSFVIDSVKIKINGKVLNCPINMDDRYKDADSNTKAKLDNMLKVIPSIVKLIEGKELWDYLYKLHEDMFYEINEDPYFDGKTIKSGKDLKNAIDTRYKITIFIDEYDECVYFCGEYWCDEEHGFCVTFPDGKFVKAKEGKKKKGKDYSPYYTYLGQFADAL